MFFNTCIWSHWYFHNWAIFALCRICGWNWSKFCEQFLKFASVSGTLRQELANTLIESLKSFDTALAYLRGQGYNGETSMSGKFKGAQSITCSLFLEALYAHWAFLALNLTVGNATDVQILRNSIGVLKKICGFLNTPKNKMFAKMISVHVAESVKQNW